MSVKNESKINQLLQEVPAGAVYLTSWMKQNNIPHSTQHRYVESAQGIECQLMAGRAGDLVLLGGARADGIEPVGKFPIKARIGDAGCEKPAGEWNEAEIVCQGDRMAVYINGVLQNECSGTNRTGYIALQSEGGTLEFRNVYLTDVK